MRRLCRRMPRTLARAGRIASWLGAAVAVALLLFTPATQLSGVRPVVVDGGSMSPTISRGDVLLIGDPPAQLSAGELAVIGSGRESYVHRVLERRGDSLLLKGDANAEPDPGRVPTSAVSGRVVFHIAGPSALVTAAAMSPQGKLALSFGALALITVALLPAREG